jgi:hypothetical protein
MVPFDYSAFNFQVPTFGSLALAKGAALTTATTNATTSRDFSFTSGSCLLKVDE